VENVSWDEATRWLTRHRLRLPSEAEWEYACRAGTGTPWITGREVASLGEVANLCDAYCRSRGGPASWTYTLEVDDGYTVHAPVGSFRANGFGLLDVHGNVIEWCADWYGRYGDAATDGAVRTRRGSGAARVRRGGSWRSIAAYCRSAHRSWSRPAMRGSFLGFRPALSP
jgi:formylglycine-generating enzyme required for sulfatase activity